MILFIVLLVVLLALVIGAIIVLGTGGIVFFIAFSDVIVCVCIIVLIIHAIIKAINKNKK